jgi:hypothetical protein
MTYSFLVLCALCEAFLLRFFVALVEESRKRVPGTGRGTLPFETGNRK